MKPCVRRHLGCDEDVSETTDSQPAQERTRGQVGGKREPRLLHISRGNRKMPSPGKKRVRVRAVGRAKEDGSPEGQLLLHKETTGSHEEGVKARAVYLNSLPRQIFQNQDCCVVDAMPRAP